MKIVLRAKYTDQLFKEVVATGAKPKKMANSDFLIIELNSELTAAGKLVFLKPQVNCQFNPTACIDIAERELESGVIVICGVAGEALKPYYVAKSPGPIQARFSVSDPSIGIMLHPDSTVNIRKYQPVTIGDWAYRIKSEQEYSGKLEDLKHFPDLSKYSRAIQMAVKKSLHRDGMPKYFYL